MNIENWLKYVLTGMPKYAGKKLSMCYCPSRLKNWLIWNRACATVIRG